MIATLPFDLESVNPCEIELDKKYDLGNGYYLILKEESDTLSINDFDCYGTIQWSDVRPPEFDGSARIIDRDRHNKLWWLPYREGKKVYDDCEKLVKEIVEYGFSYLILSLYGPARSILGEYTVLLSTSGIGGVEPNAADYTEYVKDYLIPDLQENLN
jgi:hypothetical protein